jgi:uncharacterized protein YbdZ (MbtH family)
VFGSQYIDSVWFTLSPHFFLRAFPWQVWQRFSLPQTMAQLPWRWQALAGNQAASKTKMTRHLEQEWKGSIDHVSYELGTTKISVLVCI